MADPASSAAGIGIGGKIASVVMTIAVPLMAFALGTKVVPLDKNDPHGDAVRRIIGCFISSFLVSVAGLLLLHQYAGWVFPAAADIASGMGFPGQLGALSIFWSLFTIGALPGWWIVGPFMRWFASRRDKSIAEIASDARADVSKVIGGGS